MTTAIEGQVGVILEIILELFGELLAQLRRAVAGFVIKIIDGNGFNIGRYVRSGKRIYPAAGNGDRQGDQYPPRTIILQFHIA